MDITLEKCSVYELPSQNRVGAIVHGGAADCALWPGKGTDTALKAAYGDDLPRVLEAELRALALTRLPYGHAMRVSRGRLHCDFLLWLALREPEPGSTQSAAPDAAQLAEGMRHALAFVAERSVERVAFSAIGTGTNELSPVERLFVLAKAAQAYEDACRAAGKPTGVEEVILCEPDVKLFSLARVRIGGLARAVAPPPPPREPSRREVQRKSAERAEKRGVRRLAPEEIERHRYTSEPYSMRGSFALGQYILHARFGVGRVENVLPEGAVSVLFEDGETRKLVHGRS